MVKIEYESVVKDAEHFAGKAYIRGTSVTVAGIVIMHKGGDSIDTIVQAYQGLTEDKVRDALGYYSEHKQEIIMDIEKMTSPPAGFKLRKNGTLERR